MNFAGGPYGFRCGQAFLDLKWKPDAVLGKPLVVMGVVHGRGGGAVGGKETVLGPIRRDGYGVHQNLGSITKGLHHSPKTWLSSQKADSAPVQWGQRTCSEWVLGWEFSSE